MAIFFDQSPTKPAIRTAIKEALALDPNSLENLDLEADSRTSAVLDDKPAAPLFRTDRFLVALGIFLAILAAAIVADATNLDDSSKALYGFATTIFGLVVGLISGEKPSAST